MRYGVEVFVSERRVDSLDFSERYGLREQGLSIKDVVREGTEVTKVTVGPFRTRKHALDFMGLVQDIGESIDTNLISI